MSSGPTTIRPRSASRKLSTNFRYIHRCGCHRSTDDVDVANDYLSGLNITNSGPVREYKTPTRMHALPYKHTQISAVNVLFCTSSVVPFWLFALKSIGLCITRVSVLCPHLLSLFGYLLTGRRTLLMHPSAHELRSSDHVELAPQRRVSDRLLLDGTVLRFRGSQHHDQRRSVRQRQGEQAAGD